MTAYAELRQGSKYVIESPSKRIEATAADSEHHVIVRNLKELNESNLGTFLIAENGEMLLTDAGDVTLLYVDNLARPSWKNSNYIIG